jgi:serine/threonine protein kinase
VIEFLKYSSKSDVWAFGVVIWEIFSGGLVPYPGFSNIETAQKVRDGYRMSAPEDCPSELVTLMKRCWNQKPENRPSFADICQEWKTFFGFSEEVPIVLTVPESQGNQQANQFGFAVVYSSPTEPKPVQE